MLRKDALQKLDDTVINVTGLRVDVEILDNFTLLQILSRSLENLFFIHRQVSRDILSDFESVSVGDVSLNNGGRKSGNSLGR